MALIGNTNGEKIWNFLIGKGFSPAQAAGIMGNLQQESYGYNPTNGNPNGSGPYGIVQWLGGRKVHLKEYSEHLGLPFDSLEAQLEFMWWELNETETRSMAALQQAGDVDSATRVFFVEYERAQDSTLGKRIRYAHEAHGEFGHLMPEPPPSAEAVAGYNDWLAQGYQGNSQDWVNWRENPYPAPGLGEAFEKWKLDNNLPNATADDWVAAVEAEKAIIANLPPKEVLDAFAEWRAIPGNENRSAEEWRLEVEAEKAIIANLPPKEVLDAFAEWRAIPGNENRSAEEWKQEVEAARNNPNPATPTDPANPYALGFNSPLLIENVLDNFTESEPVDTTMPDWVIPPPPGAVTTMALTELVNPITGETWAAPSGGYTVQPIKITNEPQDLRRSLGAPASTSIDPTQTPPPDGHINDIIEPYTFSPDFVNWRIATLQPNATTADYQASLNYYNTQLDENGKAYVDNIAQQTIKAFNDWKIATDNPSGTIDQYKAALAAYNDLGVEGKAYVDDIAKQKIAAANAGSFADNNTLGLNNHYQGGVDAATGMTFGP